MKSLQNSLCFSILEQNKQLGFARVISDFATFAYLGDVFVVEERRGEGLAKWLMEVILSHPNLQRLRRFCLGTKDAQGLYQQFGFKTLREVNNWMEIKRSNIYQDMKSE